ncbi:MAG: 50S ribosomal protein L11 methyltransferase [Myxococcales bacterium]|nr:50S ribosomal protein L11 methyltransferase [Myxococcales bacterium]
MLREFGRYVADLERTDAYGRAIREQVRKGDVVVDVGAGFGLLSLLCARAGARRVYAIEQGTYCELGRAIAQDNQLADRIVWVSANSLAVDLPERADVVVSELFGQFALEEFVVEYLHDARRRFLKPGGRMIPQELALALTPIEHEGLRHRLLPTHGQCWTNVAGFDLRRLQQAVLVNEASPYVVEACRQARALGPTVPFMHFELGESTSGRFLRRVVCPIDRPGVLDGIMGTFWARLSPSVELSTAPNAPPTHWSQVVFPKLPRTVVDPGDVAEVEIGFHPGGRWSFGLVELRGHGDVRRQPGLRSALCSHR